MQKRTVLTIDRGILNRYCQLYEEVNQVMWAADIFPFDDYLSLRNFLLELNTT